MAKRYWKITGRDGSTKIFERKIEIGTFSEKQIQVLLMALAAKAGLDFDEIIESYASKRSNISKNLLSVTKDGLYPKYLCGDNPHFIATIVED